MELAYTTNEVTTEGMPCHPENVLTRSNDPHTNWHVMLLVYVFLLAGCSEPAEQTNADAQNALERIVLQTDWYAEPEHGGFYLALQRGYYSDAGLDVEIRTTTTPISVYQLVAADEVQFGLGTSDNLIVAVSRKLPIVGIFPYFQHDPQGVMFHRDMPIDDFKDLDGRRVKIATGMHYVEYLQRTLGIKLQLVPMDGSTTQFVSDRELVQQCFLTSEPYFVAQQGVETGVLPFWDMGLDPYRLVMTSTELASQRPDLVRRFVMASMRGWSEFMNGDTADAFAAISSRNTQQSPDFMQWTYGKMQEYSLVYGRASDGETMGQIDSGRLQRQIEQLSALDLLGSPVTPEQTMMFDGYPEVLLVNTLKGSVEEGSVEERSVERTPADTDQTIAPVSDQEKD